MHEIRRLNKFTLHEAAVKEMAERQVKAKQRREEKRWNVSFHRHHRPRNSHANATQKVYYDRFLSSDGEDNSIDSIDSLDMNKQNKATVLKKAGSTRRNLPQLNFNDVALLQQYSNEDLADYNVTASNAKRNKIPPQALPIIEQVIAAREDGHFRSQMMFRKRNQAAQSPHEVSFYTDHDDAVVPHYSTPDNEANTGDQMKRQQYATTTNGPFIQIETSNMDDTQSKQQITSTTKTNKETSHQQNNIKI